MEDHQWLPRRRLRRYAVARGVGGAIFAAIFIGWMLIMWSSPVMRYTAVALAAVTALVTIVSIRSDARRARGRQVTVLAGAIDITWPHETRRVPLAEIDHAEWRDHDAAQSGLWLLGPKGVTLAHLDLNFLGEEAEARAFVGWLRTQTGAPLEVRWPRTND